MTELSEEAVLVERIREAAISIYNDGTPAQVGLSAEECNEAADAIDRLVRERDEARKANERDRSIVCEVRTEFKVALARRSWLLDGRGSYEWDDDRWMSEFGQAVNELGDAINPLDKIGIDWTMCPTTPEEIAEARIDWKARATAAEAKLAEMREALQSIIDMNVQYAIDRWGDAHKAEDMACVVVARRALEQTP